MVEVRVSAGGGRITSLKTILQKPIKSDFDVARAISIIEDEELKISALETLVENPDVNQPTKIGITGAPGVGKSTFISKLLTNYDFSKYKVAILAIDPSSKITKGAVLGDRIRMTQNTIFEKVYFRSIATRGALGGLSQAVEPILFFLSHCGFNLILVETVGVGQNEVEIASCVDKVIHILDSNTGDEVQLDKAGVMEIGDIFYVNIRNGVINNKFISNLKTFTSNPRRNLEKMPKVIVGSVVLAERFDELVRELDLCETKRLELSEDVTE